MRAPQAFFLHEHLARSTGDEPTLVHIGSAGRGDGRAKPLEGDNWGPTTRGAARAPFSRVSHLLRYLRSWQRMFTLAAAYDYVQAHVVRYGPFYLDSPD